MAVNHGAGVAIAKRVVEQRLALGDFQRQIRRRADDPARRQILTIEQEDVLRLDALFLHTAGSHVDALRAANGDAAARSRHPSEVVELSTKLADQRGNVARLAQPGQDSDAPVRWKRERRVAAHRLVAARGPRLGVTARRPRSAMLGPPRSEGTHARAAAGTSARTDRARTRGTARTSSPSRT